MTFVPLLTYIWYVQCDFAAIYSWLPGWSPYYVDMSICSEKASIYCILHRNKIFAWGFEHMSGIYSKGSLWACRSSFTSCLSSGVWWAASYCRLHQQAPVWIPVESTAVISIITYHEWQSACKLLPYWSRATTISSTSQVNSLNNILHHVIYHFGGLCGIITWYVFCFQSIWFRMLVTSPDYLRLSQRCL